MNVQYITKVGEELQNKISDEEFKTVVKSVLDDPNGWKSHNIHFVEYLPYQSVSLSQVANTSLSQHVPLSQVASDLPPVQIANLSLLEVAALPKHILKIYLRDSEATNKICNMRGLSCTRFDKNGHPIDIVINYKNWIGGSKSKLPLDQYHKYVINHEVGHWLGLDHSECPLDECKKRGISPENCPASIMQQMSKGSEHIRPCKESCTPLPPDWEIDNLNHEEIKLMIEPTFEKNNNKTTGNCNFAIVQLVIYILILIIVIILLVYVIITHKKNNTTNTTKYNLKNKIIY
jgi:hypothetical protein